MNRKLIAATVAAAVTAPAGVYAQDGPEVTIYGQVAHVLIDNDTDYKDEALSPNQRNTSTTDVNENGAIRFGMRINSDLGNGMTAMGQYEADTGSDGDAVNNLRLGWVGLAGSFGQFTVGQQYSAYNSAVGFAEPFFHTTPGADYVNGATDVSRTGSTLQYSNSVGPLSFGIDVRVDDDDDDDAEMMGAGNGTGDRDSQGDGFGFGLTLSPTENFTIAAAYDRADGLKDTGPLNNMRSGRDAPDVEAYGFAVRADVSDNFWIIGGWQTQKIDSVSAVCFEDGQDRADCPTMGDMDVGYLRRKELENEGFQISAFYQMSERSRVYAGYGEVETDADMLNDAGTMMANDEQDLERDDFAIGASYNFGGGLIFYAEYLDQSTKNVENVRGNDLDSDTLYIGMQLVF